MNAVAGHSLEKLHNNHQPVAEIKAVHSGMRAQNATSGDAGGLDAGGLDPVVHIAHGARVMLTSNG